ncbi:hypothetical protein FQN55_006389 [Onygenales sp. PD_40]|nr:hypothetical protein FQN55_006389 [Onygenales sp. PD_40]
MLALERSRHEQPYLQQLSMDPSMHDPFGSLNIDGYSYSHFPPGSNAFFDSSSAFMVEAPHQLYNPKFDSYPHPPSGPPSIATAPSDQTASSSASGPSIPSTSSSAIGSPYQENWMDMNAGYPQDYVSAGMDADIMFAHDKLPDSFVASASNVSPVKHSASGGQVAQEFCQHEPTKECSVAEWRISNDVFARDGQQKKGLDPRLYHRRFESEKNVDD